MFSLTLRSWWVESFRRLLCLSGSVGPCRQRSPKNVWRKKMKAFQLSVGRGPLKRLKMCDENKNESLSVFRRQRPEPEGFRFYFFFTQTLGGPPREWESHPKRYPQQGYIHLLVIQNAAGNSAAWACISPLRHPSTVIKLSQQYSAVRNKELTSICGVTSLNNSPHLSTLPISVHFQIGRCPDSDWISGFLYLTKYEESAFWWPNCCKCRATIQFNNWQVV